MMIGIGMPIAQAKMPFMTVLLRLLRKSNAGGGGLVPPQAHDLRRRRIGAIESAAHLLCRTRK